jgi:thiol-disulfide isomerase/thioredoxin
MTELRPFVLPVLLAWLLVVSPLFAGCDGRAPSVPAGGAAAPAAAAPAPEPEPAESRPAEPRVPGRLLVGDPAPALSASRWFRGEPRENVTPGAVTLVEFWATWCGPCVRAMPHISDLAEELSEAGFEVIGVSMDRGPKAAELVEGFLERRAEIARFDVLLDDGGMSDRWFAAAGQSGIPCSMLVGRDGRLAWIGNPLELDAAGVPMVEVVARQLLEGTYDTSASLRAIDEALAAESAAAERDAEANRLSAEMAASWAKGDRRGSLDIADRLIAMDPEANRDLAARKVEVLLYELREPAEAMEAARGFIEGPYRGDAPFLLTVAAQFSGPLDPGPEGRAFALDAAHQAVAMTDGTEPAPLAVLAEAQFVSGDRAGAVGTMQGLLILIGADDPARSTYELILERYQRSRGPAPADADGPDASPPG